MKILLADDNSDLVRTLVELIEEIPGITDVFTAGNGFDALNQIIEHEPELAIVDIRMPGANGYEVLIETKKHDADIKVFLITVDDHELNRKMAYRNNADGFFGKAGEIEALLHRIEEIAGESTMTESTSYAKK